MFNLSSSAFFSATEFIYKQFQLLILNEHEEKQESIGFGRFFESGKRRWWNLAVLSERHSSIYCSILKINRLDCLLSSFYKAFKPCLVCSYIVSNGPGKTQDGHQFQVTPPIQRHWSGKRSAIVPTNFELTETMHSQYPVTSQEISLD